MPATQANERGYYEHIDVVNLHDRLLLALDRGWDSIGAWPPHWWEDEELTGRFRAELLGLMRRDYNSAPLWGIKDPRLCRLLPWWRPLWRELDTEPVFLIVVRNPREVAASLARREGISRTKSYVLWLQHLLDAEAETRGGKRCFLDFEQFVQDWSASLSCLERFLGRSWPQALASGEEANRQFLDASLRRTSSGSDALQPLPLWFEEASGWFSQACSLKEGLFPSMPPSPSGNAIKGWMLEQPVRERLSDQAIELSATRKLARWYEAEWQKAWSRAEGYKARLNRKTKSAQ